MKKLFLVLILMLTNMLTHAQTDQHRFNSTALPSALNQNLDSSPYYNVLLLINCSAVRQRMLKHDHFQDVYFTTQDNKIINGLFRLNKKARATIAIFCGWRPGRKERMAPLIPMFNEEEYNLLFVDTRGHGSSDSYSMWQSLTHFGLNEPKDVIGALEFLKRTVDKPIILWGTCAGAFYCTQAVIELTKKNLINYYKIKGLVFDSGWASPQDVVIQTAFGFIEKGISRKFQGPAKKIILALYSLLLKKQLQELDPKVNLLERIHLINIPIFYVHSKGDRRAYFNAIEKLHAKTKNKYSWWIDGGSHATHQLKYKHEYQAHMNAFCRTVLTSSHTYFKPQ